MNLPSNNTPPPCFRRGFTIIELLTVVMCITVLMAISMPIASTLQNKAYRTQTKAQFSQWGTAMEMFRAEYGGYPEVGGPGSRSGNIPENIIATDKFAVALTGRHADGTNNDLRGSTVTAKLFFGNTKLLSFYNLGIKDIPVPKDGEKLQLMDAFQNTEIAVLTDRNLDGFINGEDKNRYPPVRDQFEATYDPKGHGDIEVTGNGMRAGVIFYSAGAGSAHSAIVDSKSAVTSW